MSSGGRGGRTGGGGGGAGGAGGGGGIVKGGGGVEKGRDEAMTIDLSFLSDDERQMILTVLRRDEELRELENKRVTKLKEDLRTLRLKGVIRSGSEQQDATKTCARCRVPFATWPSSGSESGVCGRCQHKVCESCQRNYASGKWLCVYCYKQIEVDAQTGRWFYSKMPTTKKDDGTKQVLLGADVVRMSISENKRPPSTTALYSSRDVSAVGTTIDEVRRVLTRSGSDAQDSQSNSSPSRSVNSNPSTGGGGGGAGGGPGGGGRKTDDWRSNGAKPAEGGQSRGVSTTLGGSEASSYPQEDDKRLLKDLMDLTPFTLPARMTSSTTPSGSERPEPSPSVVHVRKISSRKYKDSDSDDSDDGAGSRNSCASRDAESAVFTPTAPSGEAGGSARSSIRTSDDDRGGAGYGGITLRASTNSLSPDIRGGGGSGAGGMCGSVDGGDRRSGVVNGRTSSTDLRQESRDGMSEQSQEGFTMVGGVVSRHCRGTEGEEVDKMQPPCRGEYYPATVTQSSNVDSRSRFSLHQSQHLNGGSSTTSKRVAGVGAEKVRGVGGGDEPDGRGSSLSSAASTSLPSVAITAAPSQQKLVATPGAFSDSQAVSDDEGRGGDDIGELFASYGGGGRKAASHTNLNQLAPLSASKESIVSCYSDAGEEHYGKFPVSGEILFGLNYNYKQGVLEVDIRQCKDLAPVDQKHNYSDPYVKTYLLPDRTKSGKRKTRVKRHTLSPVFEEIIKYHVTKSELETRTLSVMVWNSDRFGRNDFLGEVHVQLSYYTFDNPAPKWHKLKDRAPSQLSMLTYKGDVNLCLKFVTAEHISGKKRTGATDGGELHVIVKEARNLTAVRANGFSDPFCKACLLPDRSRRAHLKSPVIKRNCSPRWNHTFLFENVSWDELRERSLELTVWDYDRLTSNDFLGGTRLNIGSGKSLGGEVDWMDSTNEERQLWQAMLDRPNCWIDGTLLLRTNMTRRKQ